MRNPSVPRPSNAAQGMRVSRVPNRPVRREGDGCLAVDLWLQRDGTFAADLALRLSPAEAEMLHAQLCYALDNESAESRTSGPTGHSARTVTVSTPGHTPDCRKGALEGGSTYRP